MKRVALTIDDRLYQQIEDRANEQQIPVASLLLSIIRNEAGSDGGSELETAATVIKEAIDSIPEGREFCFRDLFTEETVNQMAEQFGTTVQSVRSRLGKTFTRIVKESADIEKVPAGSGVKRKNGAAVYIRKTGVKE